jgi:hypothetical protein
LRLKSAVPPIAVSRCPCVPFGISYLA